MFCTRHKRKGNEIQFNNLRTRERYWFSLMFSEEFYKNLNCPLPAHLIGKVPSIKTIGILLKNRLLKILLDG